MALLEKEINTKNFCDLQIEPGMELITYSAAREIVLESSKRRANRMETEKDVSDDQWQYRFEIFLSGKDYEMRIDASDGTIIRIKD